MIQKFVDRFMESEEEMREWFHESLPRSWRDVVPKVIEVIADSNEHRTPSPEDIEILDHGAYQGWLVVIIPADVYQPCPQAGEYWWVAIGYGSCTG